MSEIENPRILVVNSHCLTAEMTAQYLTREMKFDAAFTDSFESALEILGRGHNYDVVLFDIESSGLDGLSGMQRLVETAKPASVMIMTGARHDGATKALGVGVRGFIPKTLPLRSLGNAIRFVTFGEIYLPLTLANRNQEPRRNRSTGELTERELEVVRAIAGGMANKDIASSMGATEMTVKMHVRSIAGKLGVKNRTQIAMTAVARGLI